MPNEKPTVGRIVHYVLPEGDGINADKVGDHRAAMIVRVWGNGCVNLQVMLDGPNDLDSAIRASRGDLLWVSSTSIDLAIRRPGTWHWPEREE